MKRIVLLILLSIIIASCLFVYIQQERVKRHVIAYVTEQVEKQTGLQATFRNIALAFPFEMQVETIRIDEKSQPILAINDLRLRLTLWELLRKHVAFDSIRMGSLSLYSIPNRSREGVSPSNSTEEMKVVFPWKAIPGYIKINLLEIGKFYVDPKLMSALHLEKYAPIVSKETPLHFKGQFAIDPFGKSILADMNFSRSAFPEDKTQIVVDFKETADDAHAHLHITETDHSLLAEHLQLPAGYTYQGFMQATASRSTWQQIFDNRASTNNALIDGDFQFSYAAKSGEPTEHLSIAEPLSSQLGSYGSLKGDFKYSTNGSFEIPKVEGIIGPTLIEGTAVLSPQHHLDGTSININLRDTSFLEKWNIHSSIIKLDCQLSGPISTPDISLKLQSEFLDLQGRQLEHVVGKCLSHYDPEKFQGYVEIQCDQSKTAEFLPGTKLQASTKFLLEFEQQLDLDSILVNAGTNKISGDLTIALPNRIINGDLIGNVDLVLLNKRNSNELQGTVSANVHFSTEINTPTSQLLSLSLQSDRLIVGTIKATQINAETKFVKLWTEPVVSLKTRCQELAIDSWSIVDFSGDTTLDFGAQQWPFALSFNGADKHPLALETKGFWHYAEDDILLSLSFLESKASQIPIVLNEPATLRIRQGRFELSPLTFNIATGRLYTEFDVSAGYTHGQVRMDAIPIELLRYFQPTFPASGTATASFELSETPAGIFGDLQVDLDNVWIKEALANPTPLHATLKATLANGVLEGTGNIMGLSPEPVEMTAMLPMNVAFTPLNFKIETDKPFSVHLFAQSPLGALLDLHSTTSSTNFTGNAKVAVDFSGTLDSPQLQGTADLSEGSCELLELGLSFKNITAHLALHESEITLTEFSANEAKSGAIVGTGSAKIDPEHTFPFDFQFQIDKMALMNIDAAYATASGQLRLIGNNREASLQGEIVTDQVQVTIPDDVPALNQTLDVTYINQPVDAPKPTVHTPKPSTWPVNLNIGLDIPGNGMITGEDWSSEWKGHTTITGTTNTPLFNGVLKVVNGEYRFNGKPFLINEGTITFAGDPEKKTSLYVIANREIENIKVEIILKGSLKFPGITFRSNPPLSQREILSWILFNRGLSEITPFQGTELNDSITNLNTRKSKKPDMLTKLRNQIGVDRIDITRGDKGLENEVSVQVGKYLSPGIFVSVNKSITAEANRLCIEANLIKNLKVQAAVGDDSQGELLLLWKKDY